MKIIIFAAILVMSDPWPIKITKVYPNKDMKVSKLKWCVETENGVLDYTKIKPKVGEIAFCLTDDEKLVKYDNKKKKCSCEK